MAGLQRLALTLGGALSISRRNIYKIGSKTKKIKINVTALSAMGFMRLYWLQDPCRPAILLQSYLSLELQKKPACSDVRMHPFLHICLWGSTSTHVSTYT